MSDTQIANDFIKARTQASADPDPWAELHAGTGIQQQATPPVQTKVAANDDGDHPMADMILGRPVHAKPLPIGSQIVRQLLLTARYGVQGALGLPSMVGDALGLHTSEAVSRGLTNLGLPEPQTATERVVGDITQGMAGAATIAGAAGQVARAGSSATSRAVASALADSPMTQIGSGAGGGAGQGLVRESGGGPLAQLAGSLVGSVAGGVAGSRFEPHSSTQARVAATEAKGSPEVAQAVTPEGMEVPLEDAPTATTARVGEPADNVTPQEVIVEPATEGAAPQPTTGYRGITKPWDENARQDIEFWAPNEEHAQKYSSDLAGNKGEVVSAPLDTSSYRTIAENEYSTDTLNSAYNDSKVNGVRVVDDKGQTVLYASFDKPKVNKPGTLEGLKDDLSDIYGKSEGEQPQAPKDMIPIGDPEKPSVTINAEDRDQLMDYFAGKRGDNPVNVNLQRLDTPESIRDAIDTLSSFVKKGGPVSHAETQAAADAAGITPQDVLEQASRMSGDNLEDRLANARAELLAIRSIRVSAAEQMRPLMEAASAPGATEEQIAQAVRAFGSFKAIDDVASGASAEAGRLLNSMKIMAGSRQGYADAISRIVQESGASEDIQWSAPVEGGNKNVSDAFQGSEMHRMFGRIADLGEPGKIADYVHDMQNQSGRNTFMTVFFNALLSPKTVVKKGISDTFMAMWNMAARGLAENFSSNVAPGETAALMNGYVSSIKDGLRIAADSVRRGDSAFGESTLETGVPKSSLLASNADDILASRPTQAAMQYWRAALPTSWVQGADDLALFANYRAEKMALATRMAAAKGIDGEDLQPFIESVMNKASGPTHEQAYAAALQNTFREPLTGLAASIKEVADQINLPIAGTKFEIPLGRIVMPFVKVPVNIARVAYQNSPLPLVMPSAAMRQILSTPGAARDIAIAKIGMGTGVAMAALGAALAGRITGSGPSDPNLRAAWREAGNEPYTIEIDGKRYGYNQLEPLGMSIGAVADTVNIMKFAHEQDTEASALSLIFGLGNAMLSKTYMSGVSDFLETMSNPDRRAGPWVDRLVSSIVVPQLVNQGKIATDPTIRAHYDLLQSIEARLPYVSQGLPPMRTLWGDPIPVKDGFLPFASGTSAANAFSPISVTDPSKAEPIDKWIWENRMAFPQGPDNRLGISKPGMVQHYSAGPSVSAQIRLTPEQHDRLQVLAGNELKDPVTGLGAKDLLNSLIAGTGPEGTQRQWDQGTSAVKALIVQQVVNKYRAAAKAQLRTEYPDINEALQAGWQNRADQLTNQ